MSFTVRVLKLTLHTLEIILNVGYTSDNVQQNHLLENGNCVTISVHCTYITKLTFSVNISYVKKKKTEI